MPETNAPWDEDGPDNSRELGRGDTVAVGVDVADEPVDRVGTGAEAGALLDQLEVAAVSEQLLVRRGELERSSTTSSR